MSRAMECPHKEGKMDCPAKASGFWCTLEKGHAGDHVACGMTSHRLHVWPNDDAKPMPAMPELVEALQDAEFLLRKLAINQKEIGGMLDSLKRAAANARELLARIGAAEKT